MQKFIPRVAHGEQVLVWDLPVRVMHWLLAIAVTLAWTTQQLAGDWFGLHVACGYVVLVAACTRITWGFVGTRHARFASFVKGPAAIIGYARSLFHEGSKVRSVGHNPLGALMVVLLLGLIVAQAGTGLVANDQVTNVGPLYGCVAANMSDYLSGIHKTLASVNLACVLLHTTAVVGYLLFKGENLLRPMITGYKPARMLDPGTGIAASRVGLAILITSLFSIALAIVLHSAPPASLAL